MVWLRSERRREGDSSWSLDRIRGCASVLLRGPVSWRRARRGAHDEVWRGHT